ncbi:MAG: MMPL family transporter, partial [Proteobacteria bacterium]|nr:MMPL family transporter [Pseudomonadota bacterium]
MKSQIDEFLARVLSRWMDVVRVRARAVAVAVLLITVPIAAYTVLHLGINSDNVDLVGKNLPSKINHERFAALFPNLENALLVVIDAETPELAREAADALSAALREQTEQFTDVYLPGGGSFFERNGLLYRSVDELDQFAVEMANIQPIIGELERDPSVANLASLVRAGLTHADRGGEEGERWSAVLDRVGEATVEVYEEYPLAISWEELLVRGSSIEVVTRRVIVVHPILDFERLLPAGRSLDAIERTVNELGYLPERGVRVRVTGNPAINYEEMIGLAWDIGGAGVFCFLLVALILFRALRSLRLVIAALATLLIGLIWTAGFATLAVGHLNLISIAFGILFIGLGVDFCIHLGMRYADLLRSTRDHAGSLRRAVDSVGSSLVVCALTTAIGFLVFIPTSYKGVAELGLISGGGMLIILVLTLTFFPALISSWLPVDPVRHLEKPLVFRTTWWRVFETHPGAVRWTALAAAVAAAVVVPNFRFDPNVVRMRDPSTPSVQAFDDLLADSRTSPWYTNAVAANLEEAQAMAARLRELDVVSRTVTLADYVPADQDEKLAILEDVAFLMDAPVGGTGAAARASAEGPSIEEQVGALRSLHDFLDAPWIEGDQSILAQSMRRLRAHLGQFLD